MLFRTTPHAMDSAYLRFSYDNVEQWTEPVHLITNDLTLRQAKVRVYEDRDPHQIRIHCSPLTRTDALGPDGKPQCVNWTADAWIYRVAVD